VPNDSYCIPAEDLNRKKSFEESVLQKGKRVEEEEKKKRYPTKSESVCG